MVIPWAQTVNSSCRSAMKVVAGLSRAHYSVLFRSSVLLPARQKPIRSVRMLGNCCTKPSSIIPTISGNFQSPVNIVRSESSLDHLIANKPLRFTKDTSILTVKNTGYVLDAQAQDGKKFELSGGPLANPYSLVGFHFHWIKEGKPWSEHTVDGKPYAAELHLVHLNKLKYNSVNEALHYPDGLCVLGVLLESGHADHEAIGKLTKHCDAIQYKCASCSTEEPFDPYSLLPSDTKAYWTYPGSLTTPPYSECVTWIVFRDAIHVSSGQMQQFGLLKPITQEEAKVESLNDNVRDTKPMNGRIIKATFEN